MKSEGGRVAQGKFGELNVDIHDPHRIMAKEKKGSWAHAELKPFLHVSVVIFQVTPSLACVSESLGASLMLCPEIL